MVVTNSQYTSILCSCINADMFKRLFSCNENILIIWSHSIKINIDPLAFHMNRTCVPDMRGMSRTYFNFYSVQRITSDEYGVS